MQQRPQPQPQPPESPHQPPLGTLVPRLASPQTGTQPDRERLPGTAGDDQPNKRQRFDVVVLRASNDRRRRVSTDAAPGCPPAPPAVARRDAPTQLTPTPQALAPSPPAPQTRVIPAPAPRVPALVVRAPPDPAPPNPALAISAPPDPAPSSTALATRAPANPAPPVLAFAVQAPPTLAPQDPALSMPAPPTPAPQTLDVRLAEMPRAGNLGKDQGTTATPQRKRRYHPDDGKEKGHARPATTEVRHTVAGDSGGTSHDAQVMGTRNCSQGLRSPTCAGRSPESHEPPRSLVSSDAWTPMPFQIAPFTTPCPFRTTNPFVVGQPLFV
jgi:hypothetical protein